MNDSSIRQTRRQDIVNGILMVVGGAALTVMAAVLGYLLMEDRTQLGNFQREVLESIGNLEAQVIQLKVRATFCECKIPVDYK